jgi:hypothetical protein
MKVMFMRGNELLSDGGIEVGGSRVYGGAILSKNPKNNLKWLKVRTHLLSIPSANPF